MRLWRASYRYRTKEIFGIAIFLFSLASILQMLSMPPPSVTEKTIPYKTLEEKFIESHAGNRFVGDQPMRAEEDEQVLRFQPEVDVRLPTFHNVKTNGLQNIPENFASNTKHKRRKFDFRMEPSRIVGDNGLLSTREFQGNTWSGTFMKGAVVFFVQSQAENIRRRMMMRKTWASIREVEGWKIEAVFVVGRPNDNKLQTKLLRENTANGDLLQYSGSDSISASTLKVLAAMQWAADHLPNDFHYASLADNTLVNVAVVRDMVNERAPPVAPPASVFVVTAKDGSTVTSSQPQNVYCLERYIESETTERNLNFARSVDMTTYEPMKWPPYCSEGLYVLPTSFVREIYEISRQTNLTLPYELHDVFITGILRRKTQRGDENISTTTKAELGRDPLLRMDILPRSTNTKLARYETEAEDKLLSTWATWYETIRYRFHIFSITELT